MKKTLTLCAVLLVLFSGSTAFGEDEPAKGTRWLLTLEHGPLAIVTVPGAAGRGVTCSYITLKVTNPGALARDWFPVVKALTDTRRTYVAMGHDDALQAIRAKEGNSKLVPIGSTKGKIQPGQTLDTVAIFGPLDPLYDRVRVQILGLSDPIAIYKLERYSVPVELPDDVSYFEAIGDGEYRKIEEGVIIQDVAYVERNKLFMDAMRKEIGDGKLPDPTEQYWEVSERRVFEMIYVRPGDEFRPDDDLISFEKEHWTVVGEVKALRKINM